MKKNVLTFGLISGLIVSSFMGVSMIIMSKNPDFKGSMVVGFSAMLIAFAFIFVGIKNYRDKYNQGLITFGRAFIIGLLIALIASTMYVITWAFIFNLYMPDFMQKYSAHLLQDLQASGASAAVIAEKTNEINKMNQNYSNPVVFTLYTYLEVLPLGILVTLISALILKRKTARTPAVQ